MTGCVERSLAERAYLDGQPLTLDALGCFRASVATPHGTTQVELEIERDGSRVVADEVTIAQQFAPGLRFATALDPARGRVFISDASSGAVRIVEMGLDGDRDRVVTQDVPLFTDLVYDPRDDRLLSIWGGTLYAIDVTNGNVSKRALALDPPLFGVAMAFDGPSRTLYLLEQASVVAVDVDSAEVRLARYGDPDSSSAFDDIAYSADLGEVYANLPFPPAIWAFDAQTGAPRVLTDQAQGPIAVLGARLYAKTYDRGVLSFELPSGRFVARWDAAPELNQLLARGDALLDVHRFGFDSVAVADGSSMRLRGFAFPLPGTPVSPEAGFTVDEGAERVFVANETEVMAIDLTTGATAVFSGPSTGNANEPELRAATLIDRNAGTGDLVVQSRVAPFALTAIDGRTGTRRHVANLGDETSVEAIAAVATHARRAYVALAQPSGLLRVDLETGAVEPVSIEIESHIDDLEIDPDGGRLFVIEGNGNIGMYEYESLTRLGRFETSPNTNDGSAAYDRANDVLWVWDTNNSTGLYRVSLKDGAAMPVRALFFGPGHAPMEMLHGNLVAFSGLSLYAQDPRAEQLIELWRPE